MQRRRSFSSSSSSTYSVSRCGGGGGGRCTGIFSLWIRRDGRIETNDIRWFRILTSWRHCRTLFTVRPNEDDGEWSRSLQNLWKSKHTTILTEQTRKRIEKKKKKNEKNRLVPIDSLRFALLILLLRLHQRSKHNTSHRIASSIFIRFPFASLLIDQRRFPFPAQIEVVQGRLTFLWVFLFYFQEEEEEEATEH